MDKITSAKITQAVILAGGAGTRLRPFTLNNPKPMIPVNGKPFLEHLLDLLKSNGIKQVIILTGYLEEKIRKYFKDGKDFGIKIKYSHTPFKDYFGEELKSGTRILNAHELLNDFFLLTYCDNYWPLDLKKMQEFFYQHKSEVLLTVFSNNDNSTKNNIYVDEKGYIKKYDKSRTGKKLNGVDIGFMIVNKKVLGLLSKNNSKFEDVVFPDLISKNRLSGFLTDQKYHSIGDMERVKKTARFLKEEKVIFLDRDGVINKKASKADYVKTWAEFRFLPGSIKAIKRLSGLGYKIYIISNQAGIARGMMTEKDLDLIHKNMQKELKKNGAKISGIYFCPHGWDDNCDCRKPKPGMLFKASREHFIDLSKAIFIGDDNRDKEAGDSAGCKTILIPQGKSLLNIVEKLF